MTTECIAKLFKARRISRARWTAVCPAHDDRQPSLSIREGRGGRTLLHCFAGCSLRTIVEAVGLRVSDLFPGPPPSPAEAHMVAQKRVTRERQQQTARGIDRAVLNQCRKLEAVCDALALKLALAPDGAQGSDALTRLYHETLNRLREAEMEVES